MFDSYDPKAPRTTGNYDTREELQQAIEKHKQEQLPHYVIAMITGINNTTLRNIMQTELDIPIKTSPGVYPKTGPFGSREELRHAVAKWKAEKRSDAWIARRVNLSTRTIWNIKQEISHGPDTYS